MALELVFIYLTVAYFVNKSKSKLEEGRSRNKLKQKMKIKKENKQRYLLTVLRPFSTLFQRVCIIPYPPT